MFYSHQQNISQKQYQDFLRIVGSLSNLFSDSSVPIYITELQKKYFVELLMRKIYPAVMFRQMQKKIH